MLSYSSVDVMIHGERISSLLEIGTVLALAKNEIEKVLQTPPTDQFCCLR